MNLQSRRNLEVKHNVIYVESRIFSIKTLTKVAHN